MFFVHTFSALTIISAEDYDRLVTVYKENYMTDHKNENAIWINRFSDKGLRLYIRKRNVEAIKYGKAGHGIYEIEVIITPYKLLNNSCAMGKLVSLGEYEMALKRYYEIAETILYETNIDLREAKISRIDLTFDVITPNQIYTKEIIAASKVKHLKYGFHTFSEKDSNDKGWQPENSHCFYNNSLDIKAKIYDKEANLRDFNLDTSFLGGKGLLRFEVSLCRNYLKEEGFKRANYLKCLKKALDIAPDIYLEYVIGNLDFGRMLSEDVLVKYIEQKVTQERKKEKMLDAVLLCRNLKKQGLEMDPYFMESKKTGKKVLEYYEKLGVSPVPLKADCPYIPSMYEMIFGTEEKTNSTYKFAVRNTRGRELWYDTRKDIHV